MKLKLKKSEAEQVRSIEESYKYVCGLDEVGRGPIAGPVVSCAVIMPKGHNIEDVKDSKKLSDKKRRLLAKDILNEAIAVGFGLVDHVTIDNINIRQATFLSMNLAILDLKNQEGEKIKPDLLLIDAEQIDNEIDQISIIGGDDSIYQISCASILAKVFRDDIMIDYAKKYPNYFFESHKGYGTKKHYEALDNYGPCEIHRRTFLKKYYEKLEDNCRHDGGRVSL